jgi:flagellar basal-body rod modification protein FlgD
MHSVSANYTLPTILNTLKPPQTHSVLKARDTGSPSGTTGTSSTDASSATSATGIGTTFLNLLSTELQNQDPTDPVDSTAMVGQMISLNQLDQLISINQALTSVSTATPASGSGHTPASGSPSPAPASGAGATTPVTVPNQLPFDPITMMPLANSSAAAAFNAGSGTTTPGLSATNSNTTGGK